MGAVIELLARGPQDRYLLAGDSDGRWRAMYRRHTGFAMTCIEVPIPVKLEFGTTARFNVPLSGDMMGDIWLQLRLPAMKTLGGGTYGGTWTPNVGRVLVRRARLYINDALIHDHERLWYDIYDKLFCPAGRAHGLAQLLARDSLPAGVANTLLIPLNFLCCKGHGTGLQFLPLVGLKGAIMTIELELESLAQCLSPYSGDKAVAPLELSDSVFFYDAVYLDHAERVRLLASPQLLMYVDVQDMEQLNYRVEDRAGGNDTATIETVAVDLQELNHPVRALVFVAYKDPVDGLFAYLDAIEQAVLLIGSKERFSAQQSGYFNLLQPYLSCRRATPDHVHMYTFALDLASRQPCGSVNFAALEKPVLRVTLKPGEGDIKVKVFALCVRWLSIFRDQVAHLFT
jgi:hypothetical protein